MAITVWVLKGGTNNHLTTAEGLNTHATDFVPEGVVGAITNTSGVAPMTGAFAMNEQATPDMTVAVTAGEAYVTATPTGQASQTLRVDMDANQNVTISSNSSGSTKYDWVYISIDADNANEPAVGADDVATLVTSRSTSSSTDDGSPPTYGYLLGVVTVANGASSITDANIADKRGQTGLHPASANNEYYHALNSSGLMKGLLKLGSNDQLRLSQISRQDDDSNSITNTVQEGLSIQLGWGQMLGDASNDMSESVTFDETFTSAPWVLIAALAKKNTTAMSDITNGGAPDLTYMMFAESISTSGFTAHFKGETGTTFLNTRYYAYSWIAIGPKT